MSLLDTQFTTTKTSKAKTETTLIRRGLSRYIICSVLGLIGGAAAVALTIAVAIAAQSLIFPTRVFLPDPVLIALTAILLGWGVSWLLYQLIYRLLPGFHTPYRRDVQVMLIFSTLISLLESFLFLQGL